MSILNPLIEAYCEHEEPFLWAHSSKTFESLEIAQKLKDSFPKTGFFEIQNSEGAKKYSLSGRAWLTSSNFNDELSRSTHSAWYRLGKQIVSSEYRDFLSRLSKKDLKGLEFEATFWRQSRGAFIEPHTDKADKVVTHVIYFSDFDWQIEEGGILRILHANQMEAVHAEVFPHINNSVVLVRSDESWHGFPPIDSERLRLSLQVVFSRRPVTYSSKL